MAFNPISIDAAGGGSLLSRRRTAANGNADLPGPASPGSDTTGASPFLIASSAHLSQASRQCQDNYYFEYPWQIALPTHPAAPLLYAPQTYCDLLHGRAPLPVMQCEVRAMANGVLESIPLAYYPLRLEAVKEMREAAIRTQRHIDAMQQRAKDAGQVDLITWQPKDANPSLAPADLELLDTDMDQSLVMQKDIPSLSLLQRPIYTEMGLVPQEQRHQLRVARIVPQSLAALNPNGSPLGPASPGPAALGGPGFGAASGGGAAAADPAQMWGGGVQDSFRLARSLDKQFAEFIGLLAQRKLGLDRTQHAHTELARTIWVALTASTASSEEKHHAWYSLCYFSTHYGESTHDKAASGLNAWQAKHCHTLRASKDWVAAMATYTATVQSYVASLKGGVELRKRQLHVADREIDVRVPDFQPELETGGLLRRQGQNVAANNMPAAIYPVEVLPVFPTGFDAAAQQGLVSVTKSNDGDLDFLAETLSDVHHVVLPGAVGASGTARVEAPHILVGGANLLLTEPMDATRDAELAEDEQLAKAAASIVPGATMSYGTLRTNTFQPLYEDPDSTASYVLHVRDCPSAETASSRSASGAASADGRFVTYDRVGLMNMFTKANNPEKPLFDRYVVVFDDDASTVPVELADKLNEPGQKRRRSDDNADATDDADDGQGEVKKTKI